jgi:hypothetical protein
LSKNISDWTAQSGFPAEGEGFEPSRPICESSALAPRRIQPLCQPSGRAVGGAFKEGEGFEPPRPRWVTPVFETGALAVQPTLRCSESSVELSDELLIIHRHLCKCAAGGIRTHTQTVLETAASAVGPPRPMFDSAPGRIRTCNNVILDHAPLPILGYRSGSTVSGRRRELNPHYLDAGQESFH